MHVKKKVAYPLPLEMGYAVPYRINTIKKRIEILGIFIENEWVILWKNITKNPKGDWMKTQAEALHVKKVVCSLLFFLLKINHKIS